MSSRNIRIISLFSLSGLLLLILFTTWVLFSSLPHEDLSATEQELHIVSTVGMLADIVRAVVGDTATVTQIIGTGVDPHLYTATRSDVGALVEADIIVYVGLYLEGQLEPAILQLSQKGHETFSVASVIEEQQLLPDESYHFDPHVWMDVQLWSKVATQFSQFMGARNPAQKNMYLRNGEEYTATLAELDTYIQNISATVPLDQRIIITAHDAFRYFGHAYGYQVIGIQGISTESEASIRKVNSLVETIVSKDIQSIFVESSVPEKYVHALVEGAKSQGHTVTIGGSLFSDSMGLQGSYEGSYVGMLDHNATTIVRALGGQAPTFGVKGKLRAFVEK